MWPRPKPGCSSMSTPMPTRWTSLQTAVAIFGRDQKLTFYNRAFVKLWGLPEAWLDQHPSDGEILDRLRETRKLPEQRDYQAWKRARLALYQDGAREQPSEELWHLPGGQTMRVVTQPHPFGGLTFLYEDVTARLTLECNYNTLIKVQSATLDTLSEGVAVFGPDGKLKLHNAAFARIWEFERRGTGGRAACAHHRRAVARPLRRQRDVWDRLIQAIVSGGARSATWAMSSAATAPSCRSATSPLPDGATLVTFTDVTDRFRIESALRDRNEALEAADRLKSDFIKHVSYELRTPLNTILGFSEHLASGVPGALNAAAGRICPGHRVAAPTRSRTWSTTFSTWRWWNPARCGWSWSASIFTGCSAMSPPMPANGPPRWG